MANKVNLLDLVSQYLPIRNEIRRAIDEVCDQQALTLGPHVEKFERSLAEYCGTKFAIGVSSGTDALLCALMAMGIKPGDEVIVPAFTFFATAGSVAGEKLVMRLLDRSRAINYLSRLGMRERMRDQIRDVLVTRILDGTYAAGTQLKELTLAREFNVSQAPIRSSRPCTDRTGSSSRSRRPCRPFWMSRNRPCWSILRREDPAPLLRRRLCKKASTAGGPRPRPTMGACLRGRERAQATTNWSGLPPTRATLAERPEPTGRWEPRARAARRNSRGRSPPGCDGRRPGCRWSGRSPPSAATAGRPRPRRGSRY